MNGEHVSRVGRAAPLVGLAGRTAGEAVATPMGEAAAAWERRYECV